jgi:signal transduction histidine kinase
VTIVIHIGLGYDEAMKDRIFDKLVLFVSCLGLYLIAAGDVHVVTLIVAVAISAFNSYFDHSRVFLCCSITGFFVLSMVAPQFVYFLPLMQYDLLQRESPWLLALIVVPLMRHGGSMPVAGSVLTILFVCVGWLMSRRTNSLLKLQSEYIGLRDSTRELLLSLESRNKELLEKQDYEINLATLNERNRIAREVHDHVGHVLSSSLLQIGALLVTTQDENVRQNLTHMKDTLARGLDSIRASIHNLHDDSLDLHREVYGLLADFSFCPVELRDDIVNRPDARITYCFIAIIKEALSNVIKHSNATRVQVSILEHPALYQLVVADNGTNMSPELSETLAHSHSPASAGIGIRNIGVRVRKLNGNVHIRTEKGFELFVSIPKEVH